MKNSHKDLLKDLISKYPKRYFMELIQLKQLGIIEDYVINSKEFQSWYWGVLKVD